MFLIKLFNFFGLNSLRFATESFINFSLSLVRKRDSLFLLLFLILLGALFSSSPSYARTLTVKAPFKTMTLNYSQKKISLKGDWLDLSLKRKKCNGYILDRFNRQMNRLLNLPTPYILWTKLTT